MTQKRFSILHIVLAFLVGVALALGGVTLAGRLLLGPRALDVVQGWTLVRTRFVGDYDPDGAVDGTLTGLVDGLGDRWSHYLTAEAYRAQTQRRSNAYVGIGISVGFDDQRGPVILSVQADSPAGEAGVVPGEVITALDGVSLAGEARHRVAELMLGPAGEPVELALLAPGGARRTLTVLRAEVKTRPVTGRLLPGGTGFVRIDNFYTGSADAFRETVDGLLDQGATALVFDVRNNGGGYITQLTDMLDRLLPEGPIFRTRSKRGPETVTTSDAACVEVPMAVLVDAETYSAAEFFAAQLRESAGARVVGEHTSGKGYSQQAMALPGGGALNISTARYSTGAGVSLIGAGVSLDKQVSLSDEAHLAFLAGALDPEEDVQLRAALDLLGR